MDAANRQEFYRSVEDQPIGKEHWEHERSPALTECEERSQVGNRGRFPARKHRQPQWPGVEATPDSRASRNHRWPSPSALQKCLRPMSCRISVFPPSFTFPRTMSSARCRMTLQWESKTCLLEHRRCRAERACTGLTRRSCSGLYRTKL